jgi:phage portal protein BeeE
MSKSKYANTDLVGISKFEYQHIHTHHIEKLKARLLNLADSMTQDQRQADSMKGLIKDFCNLCHYDCREELDKWALEMGIIKENELYPVSNLRDKVTNE